MVRTRGEAAGERGSAGAAETGELQCAQATVYITEVTRSEGSS